ncbi:MAG: transaldolase family protein, partial [Pseudomonadota bacterium]
LLWASTSTKDPSLPDTLYIDALIGPDTVNTVPPATLDAFRDHGTVARTLDTGLDEARAVIDGLAQAGVDLDAITEALLTDGLAKFETAYGGLLDAVGARAAA